MTIPMLKYATLFNAAAATATVNLNETALGNPTYARSVHLEINGASTPNWTLDIQGRVSPSATWHNIDYFRTDQGAAVTPSNAQLTVNWSTAQHYVIPNPPPFMRLVGTRTGGTLTVYGSFSSEAYSVPFGTFGVGAGTALIGKVGIDSTIGTWKSQAAAGAYADEMAVVVNLDAGASPVGAKAASAVVSTGTGVGTQAVADIPLSIAAAASSTYHPVTQVTTASVKGSAGNVFKIRATNENAAVRWVQLHNKATAPAGTDVPVLSWKIPAGTATAPGYVEFEFRNALQLGTGIGVAVSTTQATFTDAATATEHEILVEYK